MANTALGAVPHRHFALLTAFALLAFPRPAAADFARMRLLDGGQVYGEVVVHLPGERVTLRAPDGQLYTFEQARIASVELDPIPPGASGTAPELAPPPPSAPVPLPPPLSPVLAPAPAVQQAALLSEHEQLLRRRVGMSGPGTVIGIGSVLVLGGAIAFGVGSTIEDPYSAHTVRSGAQVAGLVLLSLGAMQLLWGIAFFVVRRAKRTHAQERLDEIDRQLQLGLLLPSPTAGGSGAYGLWARLTF